MSISSKDLFEHYYTDDTLKKAHLELLNSKIDRKKTIELEIQSKQMHIAKMEIEYKLRKDDFDKQEDLMKNMTESRDELKKYQNEFKSEYHEICRFIERLEIEIKNKDIK